MENPKMIGCHPGTVVFRHSILPSPEVRDGRDGLVLLRGRDRVGTEMSHEKTWLGRVYGCFQK